MSPILHIPSPPLNAFIDCLYYVGEGMPYSREKIMPATWLDLKFNFGEVIQAYQAGYAEPFSACTESWTVGLWNKYHVVDWPPDLRFFGVSFKPGGAYPFLRISLSELHNRVVPLDVIWGHVAAEIHEQLYAAPTIQARFVLLEQFLLARLCEAPHDLNAIQYALVQIATLQGTLSIRALSEKMGMSQNHLETLFKRFVGGTPKELARLYRFQHVLDSLDPRHPVDWTRVAHQSSYYDQSHFNKDFAAFTGHSPGDYLRIRRQVYNENPQHVPHLRELPID